MSLILKSNVSSGSVPYMQKFLDYKSRVEADGGEIVSIGETVSAISFLLDNLDPINVYSATHVEWGVKKSGDNIIKLYSLNDPRGDLEVESGVFRQDNVSGFYGIRHSGVLTDKLVTKAPLKKTQEVMIFTAYIDDKPTPAAVDISGVSPNVSTSPIFEQLRINTGASLQSVYQVSARSQANIPKDVIPNIAMVRGGGVIGTELYGLVNNLPEVTSEAQVATFWGAGHFLWLGRGSYSEKDNGTPTGVTLETWVTEDLNLVDAKKIQGRLNSKYL